MKFMSNQKGFTLMELVIVLIILGVLLAIGVPRYISMKNSAENTACIANQKAIEAAIFMEYSKQILEGEKDAKLSSIAKEIYGKYKNLFSSGKTPVCPKDDKKFKVSANDINGTVSVSCPNGHAY